MSENDKEGGGKFSVPPARDVTPFPFPAASRPVPFGYQVHAAYLPPHPAIEARMRAVERRNSKASAARYLAAQIAEREARDRLAVGVAERQATEKTAADCLEAGGRTTRKNNATAACIALDRARSARALCGSLGIPVAKFRIATPNVGTAAERKRRVAESEMILIEMAVIEHIAKDVREVWSLVLTRVLLYNAERHGWFAGYHRDDVYRCIANSITMNLLTPHIGFEHQLLDVDAEGMTVLCNGKPYETWDVGCRSRRWL